MNVEGYDIMRGVIINLATLLFAVVAFGTLQAWRQRALPVPSKRTPFALVAGFVVSYLLLLVHLIVGRWESLGEPVTPLTWLALVALLGNVVTMGLMVYYSQDALAGPARSLERDYDVAVEDFQRSMRLLYKMNLLQWRMMHPDQEPPIQTRYQDKLITMPVQELERVVETVKEGDRQ